MLKDYATEEEKLQLVASLGVFTKPQLEVPIRAAHSCSHFDSEVRIRLPRLTDALNALFGAQASPDRAADGGHDAQLARLSERVDALEREGQRRADELSSLRVAFQDRRRVDLVNFDRISVFLFEGDLAHEGVELAARGYTIAEHEAKLEAMEFDDPSATAPRSPVRDQFDVTKCIFEHLWEVGREPHYLDIGANYAVLSLAIGDFIRASGRSSRVVGFEPGTACDLARHSVRLNRLDELVQIERLAVSDRPGLAMLFHEAGHTENNRIVNRMPETEALSWVVETTSIDHYLRERFGDWPAGDYVVKIDTQASEHLVLAGMQETRSRANVALLVEFDPHNLQYQIDCGAFLEELALSARIFEIPPGGAATAGSALVPLDSALRKALRDDVLAREITFTDLVVLPDTLPDVDRLIERLLKG